MTEALREALADAIEEVEAWASYAAPYFQEKHDLAGTLARLRAALHQPVEPLRAKPRVWWKTGDEGEFMMTPHFDGMEATYRAEGWLPTYDDPADLLSAALHQSETPPSAGIGEPAK